jgi:hypothetical protein
MQQLCSFWRPPRVLLELCLLLVALVALVAIVSLVTYATNVLFYEANMRPTVVSPACILWQSPGDRKGCRLPRRPSSPGDRKGRHYISASKTDLDLLLEGQQGSF